MATWHWANDMTPHLLLGQSKVQCRLRWSARPAEVLSGMWQVTTVEPPVRPADWHRPPGLIATGELTVTGDDALVADIAFDARSSRPRMKRRPDERRTAESGSYFIRVVGLDAHGTPHGNTSNSVVVHVVTPVPPPVYQPPAADLMITRLVYEPIRERAPDANEWFVVTREPSTLPYAALPVGTVIHRVPEDDDAADIVGDAIGDVTVFVVDASNWVSNAYTDVKAAVITAVVDAMNCPDPDICRMFAEAALDAALATVGVPPSLPDFDKLSAMGRGYIVETITYELQEASGAPVPREVVEAAVDEMISRAERIRAHGPADDQWLQPDPSRQAAPAHVEVGIVNRGAETTGPSSLYVQHPLFAYRVIELPPLQPGQELSVPIALQPDRRSYAYRIRQDDPGKRNVFLSDAEVAAPWWQDHRTQPMELLVGFSGGDRASMTFIAKDPTTHVR